MRHTRGRTVIVEIPLLLPLAVMIAVWRHSS
jgi:hypothetical protein